MLWGTKRVEQKLGYVADFCPICREITPLVVYSVRKAAHVYYLKLGKGLLVGYVGKCQMCGTSIPVDARRYRRFLNRQEGDIEALIEQTYPQVRVEKAKRLEIERRIKSREPISLGTRRQLLMEPFVILAIEVEKIFRQVPLDKRTKIGCLVLTILMAMAGCTTLAWLEEAPVLSTITGGLWILLIGVSVVYVLLEAYLTPRRLVRHRIIPLLAKSLEPLRPTQGELEEVLKALKKEGLRIGKVVKAETLYLAMKNTPR